MSYFPMRGTSPQLTIEAAYAALQQNLIEPIEQSRVRL
jgi:hypothetical protein